MTIRAVRWRRYRIPFRSAFATGHGQTRAREGAIVTVVTDDGVIGVGEIAPLPDFSAEGLSGALASLSVHAPMMLGRSLDDALLWLAANTSLGVPPSVRCGFECALLDALARQRRVSLARLFAGENGRVRTRVPVNAVIGAETLEETVTAARQAVAEGFGCVKLKLLPPEDDAAGAEHETARVAAVRQAIGPNIHLRLDANAALTYEQALSLLEGCAGLDVQYIEQPLAASDIVGMRELRRATGIPIAVDEALTNLETARAWLDGEAADVFVIKLQCAGGVRAAQAMMALVGDRGVRTVLTSALESGIGVAAALHLAAAEPSLSLECGLATLDLLTDDLIGSGLLVRDGALLVPEAPGLGVVLDRTTLDRYASGDWTSAEE